MLLPTTSREIHNIEIHTWQNYQKHHKGSWKEVIDKVSDDIRITMEEKVGKMHTTKWKKKQMVKNQEKLKGAGDKKSMVKFFIDNKRGWQVGKGQDEVHILQECPAMKRPNLKRLPLMKKVEKKPWRDICRGTAPQGVSYPVIWACT